MERISNFWDMTKIQLNKHELIYKYYWTNIKINNKTKDYHDIINDIHKNFESHRELIDSVETKDFIMSELSSKIVDLKQDNINKNDKINEIIYN